jgi:hypothetical protein
MASEWMVLSESANRCPLVDSVRRVEPCEVAEASVRWEWRL